MTETERLALYVITDEREDRDSLLKTCEAALQGGAGVIQLRRKNDSGLALVQLGLALRELTTAYRALYIVNDRIDVALATDADGVHVGQDDLPLGIARRLMGPKIIGVSASTVAEALKAKEGGADYLGVGAVFATESKDDATLCGLNGLRTIAKAVSGCPVVAIGGITQNNADAVLDCGVVGLAVISAVMGSGDPRSAAQALFTQIHSYRQK
ncbi:MAG: thiamine phosphate synthase [Sulfobacillus acidophilus]|uniref:Thiamine-phosphate synthase n=1 Tax=Sulfobacillus acidophilus TaxID=53633 RepID=A0A2T2WMD9_9FIRM|nr:MAG: thiamine phosphate synthase [Sulfobacillus acidophilus]